MLPVLPDALSRELEAIGNDRTSGAMALARRAAAAVRSVAGQLPAELRVLAADEIARAQPMMAPFAHLALRLRRGDDAAEVCGEFIGEIDRSDERIAARIVPLLGTGAVVLTHSYSGTVFCALRQGAGKGAIARVIATESRPMREGVRLAEDLAAAGIEVDLIIDAAAGFVTEEATAVLVGADWISSEAVVNKTGTRLIALAARERGVPVYVLASELKVAPVGAPVPAEGQRDPAEVAPEGPRCRVRNYYFEPTPRSWFTAVIGERGPMGVE